MPCSATVSSVSVHHAERVVQRRVRDRQTAGRAQAGEQLELDFVQQRAASERIDTSIASASSRGWIR